MIPITVKKLVEKYCMGMEPTEAQENEIMDAVKAAGLDAGGRREVVSYMAELMAGPTLEQKLAAEAEAEAKRKAEEEAKKKAEEAAKLKAEKEAKKKAEAEAKRKAEEEARLKAEKEAKRKAEEAASAAKIAQAEVEKKRLEIEARKAEAAAAKAKADAELARIEEAKRRTEAVEAKKKAEVDAKRKALEDAIDKAVAAVGRNENEMARRKLKVKNIAIYSILVLAFLAFLSFQIFDLSYYGSFWNIFFMTISIVFVLLWRGCYSEVYIASWECVKACNSAIISLLCVYILPLVCLLDVGYSDEISLFLLIPAEVIFIAATIDSFEDLKREDAHANSLRDTIIFSLSLYLFPILQCTGIIDWSNWAVVPLAWIFNFVIMMILG